MANKTEIGYMIARDKCHHHHRLLQDILNNDNIQKSSLSLQLKRRQSIFQRGGAGWGEDENIWGEDEKACKSTDPKKSTKVRKLLLVDLLCIMLF